LAGALLKHRMRDDVGHIFVLPRSKANQYGPPEQVKIKCSAVPERCPVLSMDRYIAMLGCDEGPIFRTIDRWGHVGQTALSAEAVTLIMKAALKRLGLPDDEIADYASHSGRRTGITWRIRAKRSRESVMRDARIQRSATLDVYIEDIDAWYDLPEDCLL